MKTLAISAALAALALTAPPALADQPLVGIVSISANEANNARYLTGAQAAAKEIGWQVSVIDAAGNADQANAAIQNFAQRGAAAIVDMVFPFSSIGAGLDAAKSAKIPVVTWGGGLGGGVAATNGSGGPMVVPVNDLMIKMMSGKGSVLALTYHTGEVCRNREVDIDKALASTPGIKVTKNEVRIPGYFEDGAQYANAWLASHPAGKENLAIWGCWGRSGDRGDRFAAGANRTDVKVRRGQRQRAGAGEHQERLHDRHRLAGQLHRRPQHDRSFARNREGGRELDAQGRRSPGDFGSTLDNIDNF